MILSDLIAFILFCSVAAFSPGPNNFMASYSAFNFGIKKTLPIIYGVTFGFPFLIICINFGLSIIFKKYPEIQKVKESILEVGSIFASMTGSGSACFGFFEKKDIFKAKQKLEALNMGWKIISCQLMGSDN